MYFDGNHYQQQCDEKKVEEGIQNYCYSDDDCWMELLRGRHRGAWRMVDSTDDDDCSLCGGIEHPRKTDVAGGDDDGDDENH